MFICSDCSTPLNADNWYASLQKANRHLCRMCSKARNTAWRKANPERALYHVRRYRARYPEVVRAKERAQYSRNKESILAREKTTRDRLREEVLTAYGYACVCCGESRPEFLAIDHVNGDGAQHRREMRSRAMAHLYRLLKKQGFPKDRFRLLCHNCNHALGLYGYCPHERERLRA